MHLSYDDYACDFANTLIIVRMTMIANAGPIPDLRRARIVVGLSVPRLLGNGKARFWSEGLLRRTGSKP